MGENSILMYIPAELSGQSAPKKLKYLYNSLRCLKQRFVSSTGNMEVLLSHISTFNCVCLSLFLNVQSPVRWQHIISANFVTAVFQNYI